MLGAEYIDLLLSQDPEVLTARIDAFMQYEASLIGLVQAQVSSAVPLRYIPMAADKSRVRLLIVSVETCEAKEGEKGRAFTFQGR